MWARSLSAFIRRRAIAILLVAAVLTALAIAAASRVRLDQELRSLLPDDFPSVTRLDRLSSALGQQSDLYVTIRSPSREANIAFGNAVAERLAERDDIRYVVFRRDLEYFEQHGLLYASLADLLDLRRRVIAKIREEVRKQAYGDFSDDDDEKKSTAKEAAVDLGFDPDEVRKKYGLSEAYDEYMEADEGRLMVVKMRPLRPATDLEYARTLSADVLALVDELDPATFHEEMAIQLDGSYVQHQKRLESVQEEVWGGTVAVIIALLVSLAIYFRSARSLVLVFLPLLAAITGALAFAYIFHGALNLVSAFIFAVLAGLGIDFGIHMLARIRQERSRGRTTEEALAVTFETSGKTTVAGAVSTSLTFASLSVADFRGFSQFGQVASLGVMLSLIFALIVMPALMFALDRIRPWRAPPPEREDPHTLGRGTSVLRVLAIATAIGGIGFAIYGGVHISDLEFEHDLKKLGRRGEEAPGPKRASYRDAVGTYQTVDPAVALVDNAEQAESVQRQLDALLAMTPEEVAVFDPDHPPTRPLPPPPKMLEDELEEMGEDDWAHEEDEDDFGDKDLDDPIFVALEKQAVAEALMSGTTAQLLGRYDHDRLVIMRDRLAQVWSLHAFVPRLQDEKLQVIRDIRRRIDAKKASLSKKTKEQVDEWYRYLAIDAPVQSHELPEWVTAQFEDVDERQGRLVMLGTRGSKAEIDNARQIYAVYGKLHTNEGEVDVAADFFVIPEIFDAIESDGPVVMWLATAILLGAVFVLLRRIAGVIAVVLTIAFALLWLAGIAHALAWKLNFFNIIVMPLLLGMGEDDALHITERHYEEGGKLGRVLREAGGAIFMTTFTTVLGFSGILFANHRGLESMAWTAVVGMSLCLLAAVVILPVILGLMRRTGLGGR